MRITRGLAVRLAVLVLLAAALGWMAACTQQAVSQAAPAGPARPEPAQITGELASIGEGPDAMHVVTLWGTPYEMGYAHGKLGADKIKAFYQRMIIAMAIGMKVKAEALDEAWAQMEPFVAAHHIEEMQGLADGAGVPLQMVQRAHAIPDLSEFNCTFFAAWGDATPDGRLHQIRALDYATQAGIQDEPALIVCKPEGRNAFVNIGWLGFIGCVSGMSEKHIALSEIGEHFGDEVETLAGEPMPFLMRRVLEEADTLDEAVAIFEQAHRTSSFLYCIGDAKIPAAVALRTSKDFCEVYGPEDHGDMSLPNVVYWSMGCESRWNQKVHDVLKDRLGRIDADVGMYDVMRGLGTGNLHAVHYDVTALQLWVANATPAPQNAPAYNQEYVFFDFAAALR